MRKVGFASLGIIGIWIFIMTSCVEEIDFPLTGVASYVVINGKITNIPSPHIVTVMNTGSYSDPLNNALSPITNASVFLVDDLGDKVPLIERRSGIYVTEDSAYAGAVGRSYAVEVTLGDGHTYQSTPELLSAPVPMDSAHIQFETIQEVNESNNIVSSTELNIFVDSHATSEGNAFFKWYAEGEYVFEEIQRLSPGAPPAKTCWIQEDIHDGSVNLSEPLLSSNHMALNQLVLVMDFKNGKEFQFYKKYLFKVYQESLTAAAHRYWSGVKQLLEKEGGLFESPPDMIRGNMYNSSNPDEVVLGYFYAAGVSEHLRFVDREEAKSQPYRCNIEEYQSTSDQRTCYDCLRLPNSTTIRPDYWE